MGRIADSVDDWDTDTDTGFTNKVDRMLEQLDDDDDRAVVIAWLLSDMGEEAVELRLLAYGIRCSDSTIRRWRQAQQAGVGRVWAV